jgi:hypothetical protein
MATFQIRGGHKIELSDDRDPKVVHLTDDSGERVQVDVERDIIVAESNRFDIPLVCGNYTVAGAEEALFVAHLTGQSILAGTRLFKVERTASWKT